MAVSHNHLQLIPGSDLSQTLKDLHRQLEALGHLEVPKRAGVVHRALSESPGTLKSVLSLEGHRTVVLLDRHGASAEDNLAAELAAFGPTTLVSVVEGQHPPCASTVQQHIALQAGPDTLLQQIERAPILRGVADVVVSYHCGDTDKHTNLKLADKLLTPDGCYVEVFTDPRTPKEKQVVTCYTRDDVREVASPDIS